LAELPIVLVHEDLGSLNILTDDDGNVTAILDWNGSQHLPFGWNLYGVDVFFGYMRVDGWVNRKEKDELETTFWTCLWENAPKEISSRKETLQFAIKIAKDVGLLWRNVGPIEPEGMLMYLTALL
jgi:hypothetical protein